jgi:hypothetical protein
MPAPKPSRTRPVLLLCSLALAAPAHAARAPIAPLSFTGAAGATIAAQDDAAGAASEPSAPSSRIDASDASASPPPPALSFGDEDERYLSVQAGVGTNGQDFEGNLRFTYHTFLADDFEFNLGLGVWAHAQDDASDETSINVDIGFRYHFINNVRSREAGWLPDRWTMYADTGIGVMVATGEVPPGGTEYNFTPRVGLGVTAPLGDTAARLDLGVRWQHFSNASTAGSDDNPARDEAMIYAGIIFPF